MNKLTEKQKKLLSSYVDALAGIFYIVLGIMYIQDHYKNILAEETGSSAQQQMELDHGEDSLS